MVQPCQYHAECDRVASERVDIHNEIIREDVPVCKKHADAPGTNP